MSFIYTLEGEIREIDAFYQGKRFFQKNITGYTSNNNELYIASQLLLHPIANVVNVLEIVLLEPLHVKYELLDITKKWDDVSIVKRDISYALRNLNQLNIIYIDLKSDNIGNSHTDKQWKLFDFDCSGVTMDNQNKWFKYPPEYYNYKYIISLFENREVFFQKNKKKIKIVIKEKIKHLSERNDLAKLDALVFWIEFDDFYNS